MRFLIFGNAFEEVIMNCLKPFVFEIYSDNLWRIATNYFSYFQKQLPGCGQPVQIFCLSANGIYAQLSATAGQSGYRWSLSH
jgi:hypothetical protein